MTIEEIESSWGKDCNIDLTSLQTSSADSAKLHHKYSVMHNRAKASLATLENKKSVLLMHKRDYYMGEISQETLKQFGWKPNARMIIRTDIPTFIQGDTEIIKLNLEIANTTQIVSFLESIIRMINNRQFQIKNIIEAKKFENGGY